jgi:anti-sigma factor ChrR (cupin superfamily)
MTEILEKISAHTPHLAGEDKLGPLASRYVDVASLPWKPTQCKGIQMKILLKDDKTGLMTALFKWEPGSRLAFHEHVEIEQSYILEGSLMDDEGEATAGNFVWRPKGNRHYAYSPKGALLLAMFLRPNIFLEEHVGQTLE